MIIIIFGHCHGDWHDKIKLNSTKFVLFFPLGTYALSIDWVDFCWAEWHEIHVICQKNVGVG